MRTIMQDSCVVAVQIRAWSGRKRLDITDIDGGVKLPPDMVSLGTKQIFDPANLRVFQTIRKRVDRGMSAIGVKFIGGWLIASANIQQATTMLDQYRQDFTNAAAALVGDYTNQLERWLRDVQDRCPESLQYLEAAVEPANEVLRRFHFSWQIFQIEEPPAEAAGGLHEEVAQLPGRVFEEVAQTARATLHDMQRQGNIGGERAKKAILGIQQKLEALAFTSTDAAVMQQLLNQALSAIEGAPKDQQAVQATQVLTLVADPDTLRLAARQTNVSTSGMGWIDAIMAAKPTSPGQSSTNDAPENGESSTNDAPQNGEPGTETQPPPSEADEVAVEVAVSDTVVPDAPNEWFF